MMEQILGEEPKNIIVSEDDQNNCCETDDNAKQTSKISTQGSGTEHNADSTDVVNNDNTLAENADVSTGTVNHDNEGSPYGKFKSAEDLYSAYNSLQVEFTKKCQKLSEVSKQLISLGENESSQVDGVATESQPNEQQQGNAPVSPREYEQEDWAERVSKFISEHPEAREYATEIGNLLIGDNSLNLQSAFDKVLANKFKENKTLIADDEWVKNYVLQNEKVRNMVLKESLNTQRTTVPPMLLSKQSGGFSLSNNYVPASIKEAGNLVLQTLKE